MELKEAIINHYREVYQDLETRDDMLFFIKDGVIVLLNDAEVVVLRNCSRPDIMDILMKNGLAKAPKTTLDRINQSRAWKELMKYSDCKCLEYSDPRLFYFIDEALHVKPLPIKRRS